MTLVDRNTGEIVVPQPGAEMVPAGWCDSTMVPWADAQTEVSELAEAGAKLAGLEAAYRALNKDTLELTKARRYVELRWGELLGKAKPGPPSESSLAGEDSLHRMERHRFRQLAENRERVIDILRDATDADHLSRAALLKAITGAHVGHNSGENEWYTPAEYIAAALAVMGTIDLDPASTKEANKVVGAERILTERQNGLSQPWGGTVWMNPPYARPLIDQFCAKLAESYASNDVTQACVLVNNATETGWFHALAEVATAMCFPRGRVKFWHPERDSATPLQGQAVIYLGGEVESFRAEFLRFGFTVTL